MVVIKWIVILIMTWMCISIGLQLYFEAPASISPRVRKMMYKQQQLDRALAQQHVHPTPELDTPDMYDHISNGMYRAYTMVTYPFVVLAETYNLIYSLYIQ